MFRSNEQPPKPAFDLTDFNYLFTSAKPWTHAPGKGPRYYLVQPFMTVQNTSEHLSLEAHPSQELVEWCNKNMVRLQDTGPAYFNLVLHRDNTASLYAVYNRIIGQRLIARLDTNTVPLHGRTYKQG